jgi:hypothetical protein
MVDHGVNQLNHALIMTHLVMMRGDMTDIMNKGANAALIESTITMNGMIVAIIKDATNANMN